MSETDGKKAAERKQKIRERHAARRTKKRRRSLFLLLMLRGAVRWLPMSVACGLGDALGTLAYWISGRFRRQSQLHLAMAMPELPESERRRIARRQFALLGRGGFAFFVAHRMGAERAGALIETEDLEHMAAALAGGKGAFFVTFHFGCFELMASYVGGRFGMRPVGRASDDIGPTAVLIDMRRDLGCDTIQRGESRDILRTLRDGKAVGFLIDQDTNDVHGGFVPFFGRPAHTPLGPASLAVRTGLPVVMCFIHWTGLTTHRIVVLPPLRARTDLPKDDAVLELTARMTRLGVEQIRKHPDHWVWIHRRWQTRPEDHPDYPVFKGD